MKHNRRHRIPLRLTILGSCNAAHSRSSKTILKVSNMEDLSDERDVEFDETTTIDELRRKIAAALGYESFNIVSYPPGMSVEKRGICMNIRYAEHDVTEMSHLEGAADGAIVRVQSCQDEIQGRLCVVFNCGSSCTDECLREGLRSVIYSRCHVMKFFHEFNADPPHEWKENFDRRLISWISQDDVRAIRRALDAGVDVNHELINRRETLLEHALRKGKTNVAQLLKDEGAKEPVAEDDGCRCVVM